MTPNVGWVGLLAGTGSAMVVFVLSETGVIDLPGQGASFLAAGVAFVSDVVVSVLVSLVTAPRPERELVGLVYSLTPKAHGTEQRSGPDAVWYRSTLLLAGIALAMVVSLSMAFR